MSKHFDDVYQERRHEKRGLLGVFAMVLIAVLLVGGTLAYFTRSDDALARFDVSGGTHLKLVNSWDSSRGMGESGSGLYEGDYVSDVVSITNEGSDCYLRVRMRINKGSVNQAAKLADLATIPTIDDGDLRNRIVATLYNDPAGTYLPVTQSGFGRVAAESATDRSNYTRARVTGLDGKTASMPGLGYVLSAAESLDFGGTDQSKSPYLLQGDFKNVTTKDDYDHGLLTFEYVGPDDTGVLAAGKSTNPLITNIFLPYGEEMILVGETDENGEDVGYSLVFWGESVPAADYADSTAAMSKLEEIFPASDYYYGGTA